MHACMHSCMHCMHAYIHAHRLMLRQIAGSQERGAEKKEPRDPRLPEVKGLPDVSGLSFGVPGFRVLGLGWA